MNEPAFVATYWIHAGDVVPLGPPEAEASPHDFRARCEAAGRAGYRGIGLMHSDLMAIQRQYSLAEMQCVLNDCGLDFVEFEFVVGWLEDGEAGAAARANWLDLLSAAEHINTRHIKIGPDMNAYAWPEAHMIERFSALCGEAQEVGTGVVLEMMPWSNVATVDAAVAVAGGAGCANGGLLIDIWHVHRGGITYDEIAAIPSGLIHHVELNDADETVVGTLIEDTIDRRRHCGRGVFDVPAFIRALDRQGYDGPVGLEILSMLERKRPFNDVLDDAITHARSQYQIARG